MVEIMYILGCQKMLQNLTSATRVFQVPSSFEFEAKICEDAGLLCGKSETKQRQDLQRT
jgi:hypothetical protein